MDNFVLRASLRSAFGKKTKKLRREGFLPGVLYGGAQHQATPVAVSYKDFRVIFDKAGESSLVTLRIGEDDGHQVLIHDFAQDPLSDKFLHVDFYEVRMDEKLKAKVPLVFSGESPAVKNEGGVLVRTIREVEVACLPKDLPRELQVDTSRLQTLNAALRIRDIFLPEGVEIHGDPDEVVVLVEPPRTEKDLAALEEAVKSEAVEEIKVVGEEKRKEKEKEKEQEASQAQ